MKIVFFGASKFVIPLIEMLNQNFELTLVVTTERNPLDTVPQYCERNNIPYVAIKSLDEAKDMLKEKNADLGVLAYFGLLLPQAILEIFPHGILNVHPSLLPKYRGATPVQTALLNGEQQTGITIIKLDQQMDHGPMLAQEKEDILESDTTEALHDRLFTKGANMLQDIIPQYIDNKRDLKTQNDEQATYTKKSLTKHDGFFDNDNPPQASTLDRMIRAYYPWPATWTRLIINGKEKIIKFLPNKKLQVEGKRPMSTKDFINGYPELKETIEKIVTR